MSLVSAMVATQRTAMVMRQAAQPMAGPAKRTTPGTMHGHGSQRGPCTFPLQSYSCPSITDGPQCRRRGME